MSRKRILLKISGETLMGAGGYGVDEEATRLVASKIFELYQHGIEIAIVIGGGNIFRGLQQGASLGLERSYADQIGMLATLINGIVLKQALSKLGCDVRVMSALDCPDIAEKYHWEKAMRYLEKRRIVVFVGGTGHPYFTTDTCAALRGCEIKADILLKATTRVDGIYDKDPRKEKGAKKFSSISFQEVLKRELKILDPSAVALCMAEKIPILVFNFNEGSLLDALSDRPPGTLVNES